jgi:hypothetical protein
LKEDDLRGRFGRRYEGLEYEDPGLTGIDGEDPSPKFPSSLPG